MGKMDQLTEQERPQLQIDLETYLSKLPEVDKVNLKSLAKNFPEVMKKLEISGSLVIVGGSINKFWPRKDIDIVFFRDKSPNDIPRRDLTELKYAEADYKVFKATIEQLIANIDHLEIDENNSIEPFMDEEFGNENILRHDGGIAVKNSTGKGTPLEFIRMSKRGGYHDGLIQEGLPFVVLAENSTSTHT